jgi:hypothetical protein
VLNHLQNKKLETVKKFLNPRGIVCMLVVITAITFQTACSSSKGMQSTATRKEVKGNWMLNNITYDGLVPGEKYNIALLDEGTGDCLKGSSWVLPNNGYGSYTLTSADAGCRPGQRKIVWSYRTENGETIFQYKRLEEGEKAKNVKEGYQFKIVSADDKTLNLQQHVTSEGKMIYINYQFTSIQ